MEKPQFYQLYWDGYLQWTRAFESDEQALAEARTEMATKADFIGRETSWKLIKLVVLEEH